VGQEQIDSSIFFFFSYSYGDFRPSIAASNNGAIVHFFFSSFPPHLLEQQVAEDPLIRAGSVDPPK
jgi:hypothetical protein